MRLRASLPSNLNLNTLLLLEMILLFITLILSISARAELCNPDQEFCANEHNHHSSSNRAYPSSNSKLNFNPSTVPTSRGLGFEFIFYKGVDLVFVTGTGRAGAAISPSNSDGAFFGAPAFETYHDFIQRSETQSKYPTQKYTLATAFNLYNNEGQGLEHVTLNLGVMAKYNTISKSVLPGLGASSLVGPFSFSYAFFLDETNVDLGLYLPGVIDKIHYEVQTYSAGLSLGVLSLDYSVLNLSVSDASYNYMGQNDYYVNVGSAVVSVATASLSYQRTITTLAARQEISDRPSYDRETDKLYNDRTKNEVFGSFQFITSKYLFLGAFYNYYLMREIAGEVTIFF